jgi:cell division protein ZapD
MSENTANSIIYEYPLNQKIRGYLRIEQYRNLIDNNLARTSQLATQSVITLVIELTEYLYRSDFKGDVLRELDKNIQYFKELAKRPEVDENILQSTIADFSQCYKALSAINHRIGHDVINDAFIHHLRQRLHGGVCTVTDLPILNFWLHQSIERRIASINGWLTCYKPLFNALDLIMGVKRDPSFFKPVTFNNCFLQLETQMAALCRIKLSCELDKIPEISVGGNRLSIHLKPIPAEICANQLLNKADSLLYNDIQIALCP